MSNPPPQGTHSRAANKSSENTDYGQYRVGDLEPLIGVWIAEILHRDHDHLIFIDHRRQLQWCYKDERENMGWIYARVVELEAKCAFFKEAERPMWALAFYSIFQGVTWLKNPSQVPKRKKSKTPNNDQGEPPANDNGDGAENGGGKMPDNILITDSPFRTAKIFIGQGIVAAFTSKDPNDAVAAFNNAEKYIEQRGREASLGWLYHAFGFCAFFSAIAFFFLIFCSDLPRERTAWLALTCAAAGGVGAYLSRCVASRSALPCDANAGWYLHVIEAFLRWSVGAAAGALLCLLIKSKILLGSLGEAGDVSNNSNLAIIIAFAVLAGMSERFLPTLLSRFDDQLDEKREKEAIEKAKKSDSSSAPPTTPTPPPPVEEEVPE